MPSCACALCGFSSKQSRVWVLACAGHLNLYHKALAALSVPALGHV